MRLKTLASVTAAAAGSAFLYRTFLRQPILTWGATAEEAAARLAGDELLEDADAVATRASVVVGADEVPAPPSVEPSALHGTKISGFA